MSRILTSLAVALAMATSASAAPSFTGTNDITPHGVFDQR